jgi:hypothetical protein
VRAKANTLGTDEDIGEFILDSSTHELAFAWGRANEGARPGALKYSLLKMQIGDQQAYCALVKPINFEIGIVDLDNLPATITLAPLESLFVLDPKQLQLEVQLDGFPGLKPELLRLDKPGTIFISDPKELSDPLLPKVDFVHLLTQFSFDRQYKDQQCLQINVQFFKQVRSPKDGNEELPTKEDGSAKHLNELAKEFKKDAQQHRSKAGSPSVMDPIMKATQKLALAKAQPPMQQNPQYIAQCEGELAKATLKQTVELRMADTADRNLARCESAKSILQQIRDERRLKLRMYIEVDGKQIDIAHGTKNDE